MKKALFLLTMLTTLSWSVMNAQVVANAKTFTCDFENSTDAEAWTFLNGSDVNQWHIGTATHNGSGSYAMYISNDNGVSNAYTTNSASAFVYAYHEVYIMGGTTATLSFDYKAFGEANWDYLRVALIPVDYNISAHTNPYTGSGPTSHLPTEWIALDGDSFLQSDSTWKSITETVTVANGGYYRLAFIWKNDGSGGTPPPAAIDNVVFNYSESDCLPPTDITISNLTPYTASLNWEASASNTVTGYAIWRYTSPITEFVNQGQYYTAGIGTNGRQWDFDDLEPYTQYYVYIRTGCGASSASEFTEVTFTTPPSCATPLNPQVTIDTKTSVTLTWTPGDNSQANNYEYVLSETVLTEEELEAEPLTATGITQTSTSLTNLTPEATYYLYLRNNCGGTDPSPYADAVAFTMPLACSAVRNLTATNITTNSFTLSWENENWETSGRWAVEINDGADGNYLVMGPPTLSLSGLTPGTAYTVTVSTECGDIYAESVTIVVNTLNDGDIAIGEQIHIYKDNKIPVDNYYKYSYTQQIFTASELQAGKITKIAFQYLYDQPMTKVTDATIYLGHTTKNAFSSTTDWVSFSDLTPVYTGSMNCTQGWNTFELSTPFAYNGTDNLVIAVHKNADNTAYDGNQYVFAANSTSQPKTLYYHNDNTDCSPENPVEGTRLSNRNIVRFTFTDVRHDPVTVDLEHPYNDDFEDDLQWDLYQGPCVNAWAQGTATHNGEGTKSLYVSNNGGADNNYTLNKAATIYAAKQFALAAGQYDIRYDWKANGENSYDYLRVALVPASTQLAANTTNLLNLSISTLPDGWTPLDGGNKLNLSSSTWVTKKVNNVNVTEDGVYMVVFIWRNDGSGGTPPPAAIDNFSISRVACSRPFNLQAQNITSQSANLYWEMNGQSSETFTYILHNTKFIDTTNTSNYAYATGTNTTVQNLNPYSNYFYIVKTNCGTNGQSRWTEPMHFMTTPDCGEQGVRQFAIGTQPNTGNSYPAYNYSSAIYGANWMIFTADEIMEEAEFTGAIKGLAWRTPQAGGFPFQIYMAQTDKTEFESATDTVDRATMTKVFDGYPDFLANDWSEVVFDTPFEYDATGNLLVMVYRSSSVGDYPFEYSYCNDNKTIYRYGAQGLTSGSTSKNRINTRFTMCVSEDDCLPVQNLTISNIRPDSYDFSWTDGRNASVVIYEHAHHVLEGEDPSTLYGFNTLIGDGVYGGTCTGLTPGTTYTHYVRVNCGTSQSQFKKVTITTECNYITLPYTCGFESEDGLPESGTYRIPLCWHRINDATSSTNFYPYVNSSSSYAYHGNNSLLFYTASSSTYADNLLAVLPPVSSNYPMNHNQMTFWAKHSSSYSSTTIQVGTMTDVYDASTFVADTTLQLTSEYREYVARFHSNGIFPAIKMVKTSETQGAYIDDITIEVAPACPKPLYVTADNITSTEARISWTPGDEESLWRIDYMSEDGVSGSSLQTSENPCTITGLMANKTYVIKVRSVCDGNYLSAWSTPFSFRTSCDTYTPLPYTENFDLYTQGITTSSSSSPSYPSGYPNVALPSCWTFPNMATTTSGYPKTYIWKTSDSDRENVLIGNVRKGYGGSWFAVLPKASEDLNNLMLSFSYAGAGNFTTSQYPVLKMGYMTDPTDTTTFHELYVCPPTPSTTQYLHEELLLDTLPAIDAYIAFKAEPWSTSSYQVRIDDIRLEVIPTCFKPTDLSVEDLTHNSIMLSWEDPQDESPLYQIAYGPSSSFDIRYNSTYTITTATTTTCNITGLQSGTEYSFAVRTKCGDGDWSYWSQTISAKTSCLLTSLPYTENFDSYTKGISTSYSTPSGYPNVDMPDCWTFVNRTKTSSGKIFLTKSNDFAASGNALLMYGNTNTPLYAVLPAFDEPLTNLQISFTYTFSSECTTCNPLTLGYMTNPADANTFHTIATFPSNKDFVEVEQLLDEALMYQDTGKVYLAFLYPGSANVGIDNICVKEIPACRRPELTLAENWFGSSMIYFNCVNPNAVVNDTFNYQLATGLAETFDLEDASTYTLSNGHATRPTFFNLTWATTPNTKYSFAIRVQCSDNTWSEWSNVVTRKTECNVVDLPYEEYFDTYTQGISTGYNCPSTYPNVDLPECWTIVNASEYRTQKPQAFLTSSHDYSKSGNSLMLYSSEETPVFAMLPKFFEAGGSQPLKISFYYANNTLSNAGTLSIGYLYRNNEYYDTTSFRELYSCPITTDMTYVEHTIDSLPNGARITLRYFGGSSTSGVWIDEVEVVPASTCAQSVNITDFSWISHNKVFVHFDGEELTDGSYYKLVGGPAATFDRFDPSTYTSTYTFSFGHSNSVGNLQPNTEYAFAMAVICSNGVTGNWSRVATAKTLCDAYTTLPYTEDFNSYTEGVSSSTTTPSEYPNVTLPECWSFQSTSYNSPAFLTSNSSYAVSGNALVLYPKSKDTIIAILPSIDEDIRNLKLTFSYKNANTTENYPKLSVGYMTGSQNSPVTFHEIAQLDKSSSWTEASVTFESVSEWTATHYPTYIAIKCASPNNSGRVYIDNVKIKPAVCSVPLNLTVTDVTTESVSLEWDDAYGTSTEYEVMYISTSGIDDDEPYETMTVSSNTATISGLSGNTEYTFAVRAHCDGTDWSDWSSEITAKTLCGTIATLPYIENFDSYTEGVSQSFTLLPNYPNVTMPTCWTFTNRSEDQENHPFVFLSQYTGYSVSNNSLFFKNDPNIHVYAALPAFEQDIHQLKLSFYYRNENLNSSQGKLSVGYMTDPTDASTYVEVQEMDKVATMTPAEVTFRNVPQNLGPVYIVFRSPKSYIDSYFSIDEVMVEENIDNPCEPVVVDAEHPYTDGFESDQCWQLINGDLTNTWAQGTATNNGGDNALYISNDGGTNNEYNIGSSSIVYATKQFSLAAGQYNFQYDWKAYGESTYDYLRVALVPASTVLTAGTSNPTGFGTTSLPAGWIALDGGNKLNLQSDWTTKTVDEVEVDEDGIYKVVFAWCNDNSQGTQPPAAIDNFSISRVSCTKPTNLQVQDITSQSMNLYWSISEQAENSYTYIVDKVADFDVSNAEKYVNVNSSPAFVQNLEPYTSYTVSVRTNCGSDEHSFWTEPISFTTLLDCGEQSIRQFAIGSSSNNSYNYPFYSYNSTSYKYGASWQIFTADEIIDASEFAGTIKGMAWKADLDASIPFQLYMANTNKSSFSNSTDTVNRATMTLVYDGTTQFHAGEWTEIVFDTPFDYDANGDLLIMAYRPEPEVTQTVRFDYTASPETRTIYRYGSSANLPYGNTTTNRTNTRFTMCVTEDECLPVQNLAANNIEDTRLELSWTDDRNANPSGYNVEFGPTGFTPGTGSVIFAYTQPNGNYDIQPTNLTPNTTYDFYVSTICDSENTSSVKKVTASTECTFITQLPYTCGFNAEDGVGSEDYAIPECWHRYNDASSQSYTHFPYVHSNSNYAHSNGNCLGFSVSSSASYPDHQIAILPPVSASAYPMNGNQMILWAQRSSNYANLQVGTMTDPYDLSTFVADTTLELTTQYREYVVKFNSTGIFPAIMAPRPTSATTVYVDDITIEPVPSCPKPMYVKVDDFSETSALISWTVVGDENQWDIKCESLDGSDTHTLTATTNPFNFTGLQSGTKYNIYVRAICGNNETSVWSAPYTLTTLCSPIVSLPYTEDFNSYNQGISSTTSNPTSYPDVDLPNCWTILNRSENPSTYPRVFLTSSNSYAVSGNALFITSSNTTPVYAILPSFTENAHNLMLSFTYRNESIGSSDGTLSVGYMTNPADANTFVEIRSFEKIATLTNIEMKLDEIPSDVPSAKIAFKYSEGVNSGYHLSIDDVVVQVAPSCMRPTNLVVSETNTNTVNLAWINNASNTATFQIAYAPSNTFNLDNEVYQTLSANTNSVTVDGLTDNTEYSFAVRANCGNDDWSPWSSPVSAKTKCGVIATLPYTENFDSYTQGISTSTSHPSSYPNVDLPECWTFLNRSESPTSYPKAFLTSYTTYAVAGNALFFQSSSSTPLYAVLPLFAEDLQNLMLTFIYRNEGASASDGTLSVGYMTDPTDANTFVELQSFPKIAVKTPVEMLLNNIPADVTSANIAFKYIGGSNNYYLAIDNVTVQVIPTCFRPQDLTVTGVSTNTADLTWTGNITDSAYLVAYAPSATFDLNNGAYQSVWTVGNSKTVSGLSENTEYTFAVRTNCGNGDWSDWSYPTSITTPCSPITELPYTCGFEEEDGIGDGDHPMPNCWRRYNDANSTYNYYPYAGSSSSYANHGNGYVYFYTSTGSNYANTMIAVLPEISTSIYPMNENQMVLWAKYGSSAASIQVGTMTNPLNASSFVADTTLTLTSEYLEYIVKFHSTGSFPAVRVTKSSSSYYIYLDDITIEPVPSCQKPLYVNADTVTETSALLSWTAGGEESQWEVKCVSLDSTDIQVLPATTNPFYFTGLQPATRYNVYVKAVCGDNDESVWSSPGYFRTNPSCMPITNLPYTWGFEKEEMGDENRPLPDCWNRFNDATGSANYYPFVSSSSSSNAYHGTQYLYFYSYSSTSYADNQLAVLPEINTSVYPMNGNQMVLWAKCGADPATIQVGTMTDPNDLSTFVMDDSLTLTPTYSEYVVKFHSTGAFPAIRMTKSTSTRYAYVDDVTIEPVPSCQKPMYVNAYNMTESSAFISWTSEGEETQWLVKCESMDGTHTQTATVSNNPYNFTNLLSGTRYNVYVRAVCGAEEMSEWSTPHTFITQCTPLTTLPYAENFDSYTQGISTGVSYPSSYPDVDMPDCWTFLNRSESSDVYPKAFLSSSTNYAVSGNALFFQSSSSTPLYAVLPAFVEDVHNLMLTFTYRNEGTSTSNGTLSVGYLTNPTDASTFVELRSLERIDALTQVEMPLDIIPANVTSANIAFKYTGGTGNNYYLSIDEVVVTSTAPMCAGITIPYDEDFESMTSGSTPNCWSFLPDVANATVPLVSAGSANAQSGDNSVYMTSRGILVLPEITNVENVNNLMMTFYVKQRKYAHYITVGVMTDPTDPTTFTEVAQFNNGSSNTTTQEQHSFNFSNYTGNGKYIAFRNVTLNSDAISINWIDDISISELPPVTCNGITVPYEENFDNITTSTESLTGTSPDCWTFIPDVSEATIPEISYGSTNAQSGNYSLYMTGRGIYVMPEITNVETISALNMSFYVKQRKFAHCIAVGVMTNPNDQTSFVEIARFNNGSSNTTSQEQHIVDFSSYTGSGKYIAFRNVTSNSDAFSYNWIDDINISDIPLVTCEGITIPYEENFDGMTTSTESLTGTSPNCWTFLPDVDGAAAPQVSYSSDNAQSGSYSLYMNGRGIYVMPEITNVDNVSDLVMTFYVKQRKYAHYISVGVMTDPTDQATFTEVANFNNGSANTTTPEQYSVNFSSYSGNGKYIAFRNVTLNSDAISQNWIDDISVHEFCGITVPYVQNFDSLTTNTGTSTGISPRCWTFLPDVDGATTPQVSYGSANAQSGNYSLYMNGRGIYVMPEITNVDNISGLAMSFYVKQRKYAHYISVGVMTDPTDPTTFTEIANFNNGSDNTTTPELHSFDFSSYSGNGKHIAFRNVTLNSDAISQNWIDDINIFEIPPVPCDGITIPYAENFDDMTSNTGAHTGVSPACWTFLPDVSEAATPEISYGSANAQSGNYSLYMASRCIYTLPEITNVESVNGLTMTFYVKQRKYAHRIAVGVMSDPTDATTFVEVERFYNGGDYTNPVQHTVDFSSYTGNGKYIAFRNVAINSDAISYNWIDNISISEIPSVTCNGITVPYDQGFESGSEAEVANCWTFLPDVASAATPQVAEAYPHSGSNSLYMNGRGIYALPEITNVENVSNLSMSFYVRQRKYAHLISVGVMTDPEDASSFVEIGRFNTSTSDPEQFTVNFSTYTGSGKYIAFRNVTINTENGSQNWIDDINISIPAELNASASHNGFNADGNSGYTDGLEEVTAPLGVDEFNLSDFNVWPNPTTGLLTLAAEAQRVEILSLMGQRVAVFENTSSIDISNLTAGVYILKATLPQGEAVRKVVKR